MTDYNCYRNSNFLKIYTLRGSGCTYIIPRVPCGWGFTFFFPYLLAWEDCVGIWRKKGKAKWEFLDNLKPQKIGFPLHQKKKGEGIDKIEIMQHMLQKKRHMDFAT